jgi:hypothetical protein
MKKQCSNHPKYMYSGKESSPLGLGIAAEPLVLGTIQEGRDKTNWIVALKNGVKVWSRITRMSEIHDREEEVNNVEEKPVKKRAAPVKKAAPKENEEANEPQNDGEGSDKDSSPKKTPKRKPTDYNIYMKYMLVRLAKEKTDLEPKKRIAHAVEIWQSLKNNPDEKAKVIQEAKDALEQGNM